MFILGSLISGLRSVNHTGVIDRTNRDTLRLVKVANALGALFGIDDEHAIFFINGDVRAFRLAGGAACALRTDDLVSHVELSFPD
jgi:acetylglutamate kinase